MSLLRDRLTQAQISVGSPAAVVQLDADGAGNLAVTVPHGALRGWTERALAREITATIEQALSAARRTFVQVRREVLEPHRVPSDGAQESEETNPTEAGDPVASQDPPHDRWRSRDRADMFHEAVDEIDVQATSPGGCIAIQRDEERQFRVDVRPGTLRQLREQELADEIKAAFASALSRFHNGYVTAHRSAFGSDPGFG